ncbi:MAG: FAD-binding protein, partial [Sinobacteraceae bacterium]|nr:FAD-binding protein [Nevskiaceae bacterium]
MPPSTPVPKPAPVLIIGSGAAGLSCALRLAESGHAVNV